MVPGPPSTWGMAALDAHSQALPQGEVQCGRPFEVEVTLQDAFGHRCQLFLLSVILSAVMPAAAHTLIEKGHSITAQLSTGRQVSQM